LLRGGAKEFVKIFEKTTAAALAHLFELCLHKLIYDTDRDARSPAALPECASRIALFKEGNTMHGSLFLGIHF
jgi:hypothetical protein